MENLYDKTIQIMKKNNVIANKKYGQNFLTDENVINKIIEKSNISKKDVIIEIGPGLGTLTEFLLEKAGKVIAIELDEKMVKVVSKRFTAEINNEKSKYEGNKLNVINGDILKVDLKEIISKELSDGYEAVKVVANLPYYITTPIIMKLLEEKLNLECITVMVQKEVAERLVEIPGGKKTGAITHTIYYYSDAEILIDVPKDCFIPVPEVDSAVIKFNILKTVRVSNLDENKLFKLIKQAFLMRRKTILNSLNGFQNKNKEDINIILKELDIDEKKRAEQLTLSDFVRIYKKIY